MDLRWLTASEQEVAAAVAAQRRQGRPSWVPSRRQVLLHVNHCLLLWYVCIAFMTIGVKVDGYGDGTVGPGDWVAFAIALAVLGLWLAATVWMHRWAARPPSPRSRMPQWRAELTALANGFEPQPRATAAFHSMLSERGRRVRAYPRFVAPGVEFGNLTPPGHRADAWHVLRIGLPAPLPHLVLDATANDGIRSDLPARIDASQRLSLEGGFDRRFRVYSPTGYRTDALYVLTPDVMSDLLDHATAYNVEIVDDSVVFFTRPAADFTRPEPWQAVEGILTSVAPRLAAKTARYLDARVEGQEEPRVLTAIRAELAGEPYVPAAPRIGPDGRRLELRRHWSALRTTLGGLGWGLLLVLLYVVPAVFGFAGFMSIVDGR